MSHAVLMFYPSVDISAVHFRLLMYWQNAKFVTETVKFVCIVNYVKMN